MKKQIGDNLKRCQPMIDAGITTPDSQEGIDFCVKCPYEEKCLLFERDKDNTQPTERVRLRIEQVKLMYSQGKCRSEIAKHFGVVRRTINRYLAHKDD